MRLPVFFIGLIGTAILLACGADSGQQQVAKPAAPASQPAAQPANPGSQPAKPASEPPKAQVDADVQKVYDEYVKKEMPQVSVDLLQAAKKEGTLTFYHLVTPGFTKIAQEFQKVFPFVKLQQQQLTGGPLVEKFMAESRGGQNLADVLVFSALTEALQAHKEGFVMEYKVSVEDELPKKQGVPGYIVPVASTMQVIGYNSDNIKDADAKILRKWEGLLDDKWNGKRFAVGEVMAGGTTHIANYYFYKTFGTKMWERIAKESYAIFPGINPQLAAVVSGERDIVVHGSFANILAQYEKGAPVHWQYAEPHLAIPYAQFINAKAPHPNAAKLFQEYSMSMPAQQLYTANGQHSYRKGTREEGKFTTEPWYTAPEASKYWDYDTSELATALPEVTKQFRAILK